MSEAADDRYSTRRQKGGAVWEGWVRLGTDQATGRRRRKHVRGRTKTEGSDKIEMLDAQRNAGVIPTGTDTTLRAWLTVRVNTREAGRIVRPILVAGYRADLKHVERPTSVRSSSAN